MLKTKSAITFSLMQGEFRISGDFPCNSTATLLRIPKRIYSLLENGSFLIEKINGGKFRLSNDKGPFSDITPLKTSDISEKKREIIWKVENDQLIPAFYATCESTMCVDTDVSMGNNAKSMNRPKKSMNIIDSSTVFMNIPLDEWTPDRIEEFLNQARGKFLKAKSEIDSILSEMSLICENATLNTQENNYVKNCYKRIHTLEHEMEEEKQNMQDFRVYLDNCKNELMKNHK